ncbi:FliM/FliN family flagellar motor switch protein [Nitrosophilus labii]|uniref:FliM/FliN family flagellar motor switch protein n=1 Tax=Nitrosophilus labii TaxID=2706014 RepID=UPI001657004B|nr:FliM/FliN family flagellar motor switch protein [Nitrosophilus labii]
MKSEETKKIESFIQDLSFLNDVQLKVNVSVGSTKKMLFEIVSLKEGDVLKLDSNIEGYINVYINNQSFAIGEMVVANDKYGVRIIDLA